MSAYWTVYKNVPRGVRRGDSSRMDQATRLGMFHGGRWNKDYEVKLSMFGALVIDLFGDEFAVFFPREDGDLVQLHAQMSKIPALLVRIPAVVEIVTRGDHRDKDTLLAFLIDLRPTLRRIQQEAPNGEGWAIVAD